MLSWTKQTGFPVVTAKKQGNELVISQQRFLSNGKKDSGNTLWAIPVTIVTSTGQTLSVVMDAETVHVRILHTYMQ